MSPKPGDFGLVRIQGFVGALVFLGQWFNGDRSRWTHAFLLLDDDTVIEAMPQGARIVPLSTYADREIRWSNFDLHPELRREIVQAGLDLEGTPYSFADYAALFFERIGFGFGFIRTYVRNTGHMICSQLVDEAYRRAGVRLFIDGRLPQDVTPGDLDKAIKRYRR